MNMTNKTLQPGTQVTTSGFAGSITRHCFNTMYEVRLSRGTVCVPLSDIEVTNPTSSDTAILRDNAISNWRLAKDRLSKAKGTSELMKYTEAIEFWGNKAAHYDSLIEATS